MGPFIPWSTTDLVSQARWPTELLALLQAYNNTTSFSTSITPHYVLFDRHIRLPIDVMHDAAPPLHRHDLKGWVQNHHQTLLEAYVTVQNNVERRQQLNEATKNT